MSSRLSQSTGFGGMGWEGGTGIRWRGQMYAYGQFILMYGKMFIISGSNYPLIKINK